jgi:hypothetical protein
VEAIHDDLQLIRRRPGGDHVQLDLEDVAWTEYGARLQHGEFFVKANGTQ